MIIVGGENLIDYIQEPSNSGHPLYRANPGGSPFNTAMAMGRQAVDVGYLTPISEDTLGQLLRDTITASGVTCLALPNKAPTSLAVVSLIDGQPAYQFYRDNTAERQVTSEMLESILPTTITAMQIGSLAIANGDDAHAWTTLAETLSAKSVPITFDPNIRPAFIHDREDYLARFQKVMKASDLMKLSDEDMEWLYPGEDPKVRAAQIFTAEDLGLLVLTRGADGADVFCQSGQFHVPSAPVSNLVDTVGAGDTFMATLVAEHVKRGLIGKKAMRNSSENQVREIVTTAARAAAINCQRKGCNPPTVTELHQ